MDDLDGGIIPNWLLGLREPPAVIVKHLKVSAEGYVVNMALASPPTRRYEDYLFCIPYRFEKEADAVWFRLPTRLVWVEYTYGAQSRAFWGRLRSISLTGDPEGSHRLVVLVLR